MLKKLLFGAGLAYLAKKFIGGRRSAHSDYDRSGTGFGLGGSRWGRGGMSW